MHNFKELIKNRKFFTFFLSLFIFINGLLIFALGLLMIFVLKALENVSGPLITSVVIILGTILMFVGYIIPKLIIQSMHNVENEKEQNYNERKNVLQNINGFKLASDEEKQNYILIKKIKNNISFPIMLTLSLILFAGFTFFMVSFIEKEKNNFLLFMGILFITIGIIIFYINKNKNKNIIKQIMNNNIYVANCYAYDRKTKTIRIPIKDTSDRYITLHLIKVTDGNYYIDKWFSIDYTHFYDQTINVKLYLSEEIDIYDIVVDV